MIISKGVDVECFPNLFSITFVDLTDYINKFKDCVNEKGKAIPLTECLSVEEIKKRLSEVKSDIFWISDTDDSQLISMIGYINSLSAKYDENNKPIRYDLYGFNNSNYDDMMIKSLLMCYNKFPKTKNLLTHLKNINNKIISLQNNKEELYADKELNIIRNYRLPYATIDVQQIFSLHSAGVNVDKNTGERQKFGKSLKQTSINLKWYNLLDFVLPPVEEEEYYNYYVHNSLYKNLTIDEINKLKLNDFDRYISPEYIEPMLDYNKNDVFIVCEIVRLFPDEIRLRYSISSAFGVNVLSSARANIADKLTAKFYSNISGLHKKQFEHLRTERDKLNFDKIIFPHIKFKTDELSKILDSMKKTKIYKTNKSEFCEEITYHNTTYTLATGGIHSVDTPKIYESDEEFVYRHFDMTSYYPSIMISYDVYPEHLHQKSFTKMISFLKDTRVKCKHGGDINVIEGVPNKIAAEALKIVINSIYGKLGSNLFFLFDRLAQMKVTINGQLMTMTLIEDLELNNIHVISANTDGIVVKLPRKEEERFKTITSKWCEINKMGADYEDYNLLIVRDVNNYLAVQTNGSIDFKGAFDPKQYLKDLKKGYDMPIVAKAVYEYFVNDVPIMETLYNHKDILDFCKTQNVGRQFEVVYDKIVDGKVTSIYSQRHVRFYVSTNGVIIQKEHISLKNRSKLAGGLPVKILNTLDDMSIEDREINYKYYYDEAYKIINPIKLQISSNQKGNSKNKTLSGKALLKKYNQQYLSLFDD